MRNVQIKTLHRLQHKFTTETQKKRINERTLWRFSVWRWRVSRQRRVETQLKYVLGWQQDSLRLHISTAILIGWCICLLCETGSEKISRFFAAWFSHFLLRYSCPISIANKIFFSPAHPVYKGLKTESRLIKVRKWIHWVEKNIECLRWSRES